MLDDGESSSSSVVFFRCRHCRRLARLAHLPSASLARSPALPSGALLSLAMLLWLISLGRRGGGCDAHVNGGVGLGAVGCVLGKLSETVDDIFGVHGRSCTILRLRCLQLSKTLISSLMKSAHWLYAPAVGACRQLAS